jgi:K(+)-stimulated pyrophosphate-energized sodium pump
MAFINNLLKPEYIPFIIIILVAATASIVYALYLAFKVRSLPEGTPKMQQIAQYIREGSQAYLHRQFKTIIIIGAIIAVGLAFGIDYWVHWRVGEFSMVFGAFIIGISCSLIAGYIAMYTATNANVRCSNKIKEEGMSAALKVALNGGLVMGLAVVGLSLLSVALMFIGIAAIVPDPRAIESSIIGLAFGASFAALFALLGGGIYTKAADVGTDLVGKVESEIPEDDPRNPGVIADNVGDNVGDIAGRGADLFESITGQNIATIVLAVILFEAAPEDYQIYALLFPLCASAIGLIATVIGKFFIRGKDADRPWHILIKGLYVTTALCAVFLLLICFFMFKGVLAWYFFGAAMLGLIASLLIGFITLYYTDEHYRPVKSISEASKGGSATTTIAGISVGLESTGLPVIVMLVALVGSYFLGAAGAGATGVLTQAEGGIFGTALSALGLFSVCAMVLSLDGFGPIVDNAGGIAEMAQLESAVRK